MGQTVRVFLLRIALPDRPGSLGAIATAMGTVGADISFAYSGRPDQLAADLRSKGVDLSGSEGSWMLRVSAPQ